MGEFRMPSLGADMDFGTVAEWRVAAGDTVHRGDIVAVVETDKSTIEVEVFEDGVVTELLVAPGDEVPVGAVLAQLAPLGAEVPVVGEAAVGDAVAEEPEVPEEPELAEPAEVEEPKVEQPEVAPAKPARRFVRSSPRARRAAAERGVDLSEVTGSGPDGAVLAVDLDRTPEPAAAPAPARGRGPAKRSTARQVTAELMARSKREVPHYYLATTIDCGPLLAWLEQRNAELPPAQRLLPAAALLRATAVAASRHPDLNGWWKDGDLVSAERVDLGVAVALRGGGLVAPAITAAEELGLEQVMEALRGLVERARGGRLRSSDTAEPSITVTNLGDQGVEEVFGVIYPPQVALVGFGRIAQRPWASGSMLGVRPVVRATLAADHRASTGHEGARLLGTIEQLLSAPEDL